MNSRSQPRRWSLGPRNRKSQGRPARRTVLIVCEGRETERNYLDSLKREDVVSRRFTITVVKGRGGSRRQIVQRAVDQKNNRDSDFDEVWCVLDVERLATEEARNDLRDAVQIARQNQVTLCLSNPAFEVWILAHFVRSSRQFNDCDAVIVELNKHWAEQFQIDFSKNDRRIYARIANRTSKAIGNAKAVRELDHPGKTDIADCNSATEMYLLVLHLTQ